MNIYFDNVLIDNDSYVELSNQHKLFTDNFYLGSVASNTFRLTISKAAVINHPVDVRIEDGTTIFHTIVDEIKEDKGYYTYYLIDKLVNFNFNYDAKPLVDAKAQLEEDCYLSDIFADMCSKAGVLSDYVISNDLIVDWYDSTITAREYLSYIAELEGGFARIGSDGKLTIIAHKTASTKTITTDSIDELILTEEKNISKVVYDNGIVKYEFGDNDGNILYLNPNNVFINNTTAEAIFNKIDGFRFYTLEVPRCTMDSTVRSGDVITFTDGVSLYPTIAQTTMSYGGGWVGGYKLIVETKQQEETQIQGLYNSVKSIKTVVDRTNGSLAIIAEETNENSSNITSLQITTSGLTTTVSNQTGQISQLTLDVNQLRNEIGDVTDVTTQEEGVGTLVFENINVSEPINITIKPSSDSDISYLYPSSRLFPSSSLFPKNRILRFYNSTEDETIDYVLPGNLRCYNSEICDEFFLDYGSLTCKIVRRVAIDGNMVKTALAEPVEEVYDYPSIPLTTGDYTVTMPGYPNVYMKIRLMSQNVYTSQFATKVELNSKVQQTADEINLEVSKKVDETEIISKINQTAEEIKIESDKLTLEGYTTINDGFSVDLDGNATMNNATINGSTLKLADNTEIVGGNGILTNLQYKNAGINPLGFRQISLEGVAFVYGFIELEAFIPANFTVREAYITLTVYKTLNQFLKDDVEFISTNEYGKVTNIKLYKVASSAEMVNSTEFGSFNFEMPTGTEIPNAFAVGGYTNPTISGATVTSIDIKNSLSAGTNSFYIATSDALPGDTDADATLAAQKTQLAIAILTIIGFTK